MAEGDRERGGTKRIEGDQTHRTATSHPDMSAECLLEAEQEEILDSAQQGSTPRNLAADALGARGQAAEGSQLKADWGKLLLAHRKRSSA
jgi:hypothetical protein